PVPLQVTCEACPTAKVHSSVPLQIALQPAPHAVSQPAVLLQVATHSSPQVMSQREVPEHVQVPPTQRQPKSSRPPPQRSGPPGFGTEGPQPAAMTKASAKSGRADMDARLRRAPPKRDGAAIPRS